MAVPGLKSIFDIAQHQTNCDFRAAKSAGLEAVIIKATEGMNFVDPQFHNHLAGARAAGLMIGMYHFGTGSDGVGQADDFLAAANPGPDNLLVLDFEKNPNPHGTQMTVPIAEKFVQRVREKTGRFPAFFGVSSTRKQVDLIRVSDIRACDPSQIKTLDEFPGTHFTPQGFTDRPILPDFDWDGEFLFLFNTLIRNGGWGDLYVYDLPLNYYQTLPSKIDSVSVTEVRRVATLYLRPEAMVVVAVGDNRPDRLDPEPVRDPHVARVPGKRQPFLRPLAEARTRHPRHAARQPLGQRAQGPLEDREQRQDHQEVAEVIERRDLAEGDDLDADVMIGEADRPEIVGHFGYHDIVRACLEKLMRIFRGKYNAPSGQPDMVHVGIDVGG